MTLQEAEALQIQETLAAQSRALSEQIEKLQRVSGTYRVNTYSETYKTLTKIAESLTAYGELFPDTPLASAQIITATVAEGCSILKMPLPKRRAEVLNQYALRSDLRRSLAENIIPNLCSINTQPLNTLTFAYAHSPEIRIRHPIDHDHYYFKPIIDSICAAHGIDDNSTVLNLCFYHLTDVPELSPWLYAIFSPGRDAPSRETVIRLCSLPELRK